MPTDVIMPQMGESIFEGTITKWLKKPGDSVQQDEPLFEISTDKVDAEIPAPVAGVLSQIKAAEGETVQVNTVVAVIGGSAAGATSAPTSNAASSAAAESAHAVEASSAAAEAEAASAGTNARPRSSPLVRRIAKDNNLDLRRIHGTGAGGRITKQDALSYLASNGKGASAPSTAAQASAAAASPVVSSPALPGELVPLSRMRSIIAQRMVESARISPHVHTVFKVDMTRIVRLREREKGKYEQRNGVKLTAGFWIDEGQYNAIEGHYFALIQGGTSYDNSQAFSTNPNAMILARPFFNTQTGAQDSSVLAFPNFNLLGTLVNLDGTVNELHWRVVRGGEQPSTPTRSPVGARPRRSARRDLGVGCQRSANGDAQQGSDLSSLPAESRSKPSSCFCNCCKMTLKWLPSVVWLKLASADKV